MAQVLEQLADVVELLVHRDFGVAPMLPKVCSVVAQDRHGRWGTALDGAPRRHRHAHDLVDAAQRAHRRTRKAEVGGVDLA